METSPEEGGAATPPVTAEPDVVVKRTPWGRIAAVVLVIVLIFAALALLTRQANRIPAVTQTTASNPSPRVGDSVAFTAQATDPDGDTLTFLWDFGDGTSAPGAQASHAYSLPGKFIALLTVSDGKGGEATNDANLTRVTVAPRSVDVAPPNPLWCTSSCGQGPVIAVINASESSAAAGAPIAFNALSSWAYAFTWNNSLNHSQGGTFTRSIAEGNATLFDLFRYIWGDGTANTTGTSDLVGRTNHTFDRPGNFFVQLAVTYANADLNPPAKTAVAGFTVRVVPSAMAAASMPPAPFGDSPAAVAASRVETAKDSPR